MTDEQAREVLMMVLQVAAILEEDVEEIAQAELEQAEDKKSPEELRVEIVKLLPDLNLEQLVSVARFVGVTEKEIAEDLARAGA